MDPREKREDESWAEYGARMSAMGIAPTEDTLAFGPQGVGGFKYSRPSPLPVLPTLPGGYISPSDYGKNKALEGFYMTPGALSPGPKSISGLGAISNVPFQDVDNTPYTNPQALAATGTVLGGLTALEAAKRAAELKGLISPKHGSVFGPKTFEKMTGKPGAGIFSKAGPLAAGLTIPAQIASGLPLMAYSEDVQTPMTTGDEVPLTEAQMQSLAGTSPIDAPAIMQGADYSKALADVTPGADVATGYRPGGLGGWEGSVMDIWGDSSGGFRPGGEAAAIEHFITPIREVFGTQDVQPGDRDFGMAGGGVGPTMGGHPGMGPGGGYDLSGQIPSLAGTQTGMPVAMDAGGGLQMIAPEVTAPSVNMSTGTGPIMGGEDVDYSQMAQDWGDPTMMSAPASEQPDLSQPVSIGNLAATDPNLQGTTPFSMVNATGNLAGYGTSPYISQIAHVPSSYYDDMTMADQRLADEDAAAVVDDFSAIAPVTGTSYARYLEDPTRKHGKITGPDYVAWMQEQAKVAKATPTMERVREQEAITAGEKATKTAGGLDKIARDRIANQEAIERKMEEDAARINQKREDAARALEDSKNLARRKEEEEIRKATAWVFEERRVEEVAAATRRDEQQATRRAAMQKAKAAKQHQVNVAAAAEEHAKNVAIANDRRQANRRAAMENARLAQEAAARQREQQAAAAREAASRQAMFNEVQRSMNIERERGEATVSEVQAAINAMQGLEFGGVMSLSDYGAEQAAGPAAGYGGSRGDPVGREAAIEGRSGGGGRGGWGPDR
jgi:hypothetical protein